MAGDELQTSDNTKIIESQRIWINLSLFDFYQMIAKVVEVSKTF
jgi:hypothetical protein